MPYSNDNDLLIEFTSEELIDLSGGSGSINTDRTTAARSKADRLIDVHLFGVYDVPFEETPELIKDISISLTIYNLFLMSYKRSVVPVPVITRKIDAIKLLKDLRDKNLFLTLNDVIYTNTEKPIFDRETLNKYLD